MFEAEDKAQTKRALDWLASRGVGATFVEFLQQLPPTHAEAIHAAAVRLVRLSDEVAALKAQKETARGVGAGAFVALIALSFEAWGYGPNYVPLIAAGGIPNGRQRT